MTTGAAPRRWVGRRSGGSPPVTTTATRVGAVGAVGAVGGNGGGFGGSFIARW